MNTFYSNYGMSYGAPTWIHAFAPSWSWLFFGAYSGKGSLCGIQEGGAAMVVCDITCRKYPSILEIIYLFVWPNWNGRNFSVKNHNWNMAVSAKENEIENKEDWLNEHGDPILNTSNPRNDGSPEARAKLESIAEILT